MTDISLAEYERMCDPSAMREHGIDAIEIEPLDAEYAAVIVMRRDGRKVAQEAARYKVGRTEYMNEIFARRRRAEEERQARIAAGEIVEGMTTDQLVETKGKHCRLIDCNRCQRPATVFRYDDVTVLTHVGKVESSWPSADDDERLAELSSVDWRGLPYEDSVEGQ